MPPWGRQRHVQKNLEGLYAYLKGRSDGKIKPGHLQSASAMTRVLFNRGRGCAVLTTAALALCAHYGAAAENEGVLKVCADPSNLPLSNDKGEGYENKIAEALARDLKMKVEYTFLSPAHRFHTQYPSLQRRGIA